MASICKRQAVFRVVEVEVLVGVWGWLRTWQLLSTGTATTRRPAHSEHIARQRSLHSPAGVDWLVEVILCSSCPSVLAVGSVDGALLGYVCTPCTLHAATIWRDASFIFFCITCRCSWEWTPSVCLSWMTRHRTAGGGASGVSFP